MNHAARQALYRQIEADRKSKVVAFVTGERPGLQTQIAGDAIEPFVSLLDEIGPVQKLSLVLDTTGGQTSAAWRLINLLRSFCEELEVIIPTKAMSAGTLMSLGAEQIVMTKQAALGPIDPSIPNHPLAPMAPAALGGYHIPVSAEAVRGYIDQVKKDITDPMAMAQVWTHLSSQIHPLILGEIFRLGEQTRSMAKKLIKVQVNDEATQDKIIQLLCSDSGSHDYTINRRTASDLGLNVVKPSAALYDILKQVAKSYHDELKTLDPFSPMAMLGGASTVKYALTRGLIEATDAGCYGFVSEGEFSAVMQPNHSGQQTVVGVTDNKAYEGWKKL